MLRRIDGGRGLDDLWNDSRRSGVWKDWVNDVPDLVINSAVVSLILFFLVNLGYQSQSWGKTSLSRTFLTGNVQGN